METKTLNLNYINFEDFLYKYFDLELTVINFTSVILQLLFIAWLAFQIFQKLKGTQAERVLRGLVLLCPIILLCYVLKLQIITKIIEILSSTIVIGLVVIFAPEFRRVLMQLGGNLSLVDYVHMLDSGKSISDAKAEIIGAVKTLSANQTGALFALEKANVERYYLNPGHTINAALSKELILTILNPKSPLHDGAIIIKGFTLIAAGVILPVSENPRLDSNYGTRHRAAVGFSEVTDALLIVVSEERGEISVALEGRLTKLNAAEDLDKYLETFYTQMLKK